MCGSSVRNIALFLTLAAIVLSYSSHDSQLDCSALGPAEGVTVNFNESLSIYSITWSPFLDRARILYWIETTSENRSSITASTDMPCFSVASGECGHNCTVRIMPVTGGCNGTAFTTHLPSDALFLRFQYTVREGKKFKHNFAAFAPQVNSLPKEVLLQSCSVTSNLTCNFTNVPSFNVTVATPRDSDLYQIFSEVIYFESSGAMSSQHVTLSTFDVFEVSMVTNKIYFISFVRNAVSPGALISLLQLRNKKVNFNGSVHFLELMRAIGDIVALLPSSLEAGQYVLVVHQLEEDWSVASSQSVATASFNVTEDIISDGNSSPLGMDCLLSGSITCTSNMMEGFCNISIACNFSSALPGVSIFLRSDDVISHLTAIRYLESGSEAVVGMECSGNYQLSVFPLFYNNCSIPSEKIEPVYVRNFSPSRTTTEVTIKSAESSEVVSSVMEVSGELELAFLLGITVGATLAMLTLFATLVVVGACVVRYTMKRRVYGCHIDFPMSTNRNSKFSTTLQTEGKELQTIHFTETSSHHYERIEDSNAYSVISKNKLPQRYEEPDKPQQLAEVRAPKPYELPAMPRETSSPSDFNKLPLPYEVPTPSSEAPACSKKLEEHVLYEEPVKLLSSELTVCDKKLKKDKSPVLRKENVTSSGNETNPLQPQPYEEPTQPNVLNSSRLKKEKLAEPYEVPFNSKHVLKCSTSNDGKGSPLPYELPQKLTVIMNENSF